MMTAEKEDDVKNTYQSHSFVSYFVFFLSFFFLLSSFFLSFFLEHDSSEKDLIRRICTYRTSERMHRQLEQDVRIFALT